MDYKKIIKESGLKQSWLCKQIGITDAMLSMFLNNKTNMSPEKIRKLNTLLKINEGE